MCFLIIWRDLTVGTEEHKWGNISVFLLSLLWHTIPAACPTCRDVSFMKFKKKRKRKPNTVFLLSLNCYERSTQSACRGWDSAEGCGAQKRRPPSLTAQSHILSKRKRLALSLKGGTHALMWSQLSTKPSCGSIHTSQPHSALLTSCHTHAL